MKLTTPFGEVEIVNERTYSFGSADNTRCYGVAENLSEEGRPVSVHGVLLDGEPLAVFGASGGTTRINDHSALWLNDQLYVAVCHTVVCLQLSPCHRLWSLRADTVTCFGIHFHEPTGSLISHGEAEITRFSEDGEILWGSIGRGIFTGDFSLEAEFVRAEDCNGDEYRFHYDSGKDAT